MHDRLPGSFPDESDRASFLTWGNGIADITVLLLRKIIQAVSDPNDADYFTVCFAKIDILLFAPFIRLKAVEPVLRPVKFLQ